MAIRRAELTVTFECDYMVNAEGEITGLLILDKGGVIPGKYLLELDSVIEDLQADNENKILEENA